MESRVRALIAGPEGGFTLTELLVAIGCLTIILGALMQPLFVAGHQQDDQADRVNTIDSDRVAFDRMTREIRQAGAVKASSSNGRSIDLYNYTGTTLATTPSVRYDCSGSSSTSGGYRQCVRTIPSTGSSALVIDAVADDSSSPIFCVKSDPSATTCLGNGVSGGTFVAIHLQKKTDDAANPVILDGGVSLRVHG